jgi:hypothetical protein
MPTLFDIFRKKNIPLYQNESLDLDHYYQEPYQDNDSDTYDMAEPFETDKQKRKRRIDIESERQGISYFSFFMDGSRRTYKIGDIVLSGKQIFPVVVAQVRAGSTHRMSKGVHKHIVNQKNLLLISSVVNDVDFEEIKLRIQRSVFAQHMGLEVVQYRFDRDRDILPVNSAIAKANSVMHTMEIDILTRMVTSNVLHPTQMLVVDGPLQFIAQDTGKDAFADLFYNVIGVSKTPDPMLPISEKTKRGGTQIGAQLLHLGYAERTPVFHKQNARGRVFGCWYLRLRPPEMLKNPLEGIVKVEKMAVREEYDDGLASDVVDNISRSLLEECSPTCHGKDERWASHLYPVYLTEVMIKSLFWSDISFINQFKRNFT